MNRPYYKRKPQPLSELVKGNAALRRLQQINGADYEATTAPLRAFKPSSGIGTHYQIQPAPEALKHRQMIKLRVVNNTKYTKENGQLILPQEITSLIDNKAYMNRHKKLARDYGVDYLLKLAELAKTKGKPSHWYAKATSVKQWKEQTEKMLSELMKKLEQLKEKLAKIGVNPSYLPYYLKASRRLSEYKFNRCIENALSRGVNNPPHLFAKAIAESLSELQPATA